MEKEWDIFGENAKIVTDADIPVFEGCAYFSVLSYQDMGIRTSRLRIFSLENDWSYCLFGGFSVADAIDCTLKLPPACEELDGLRCSVAQATADLGKLGRTYGRDTAGRHLFRVEDSGNSGLERGTVFDAWGFGLEPSTFPRANRVYFPNEAVWAAEAKRIASGSVLKR
ncbi:hypothetical protein [Mesorhizobium sp. 1B3]|uniref:hypothetical protein n=1 Tax=Mesorhizobium sp. 1B3 TaxID=3243599 RepID=UPI003D9822BD